MHKPVARTITVNNGYSVAEITRLGLSPRGVVVNFWFPGGITYRVVEPYADQQLAVESVQRLLGV